MPPTPLILDTDVGTDADDAVALGLALASPEIELRAVTVVSGDVDLRARTAKKLLCLGGRADVPVYPGCTDPLKPSRTFLWLGHEGKGIVDDRDQLTIETRCAADILVELAAAEPMQIAAIGPLSNLALALRRQPSVAAGLVRLTLMGGVLGIGSDPTTPPVEYNLASDAEASVEVLNAGMATTIVPLDVTWQTRLRAGDLARLRRSRSPLVQTLCDALEIWWSVHRALFAGKRAYNSDVVCFLHDPLALSTLLDPSFLTLAPLRLVAEIRDGAFCLRQDAAGREVTVATRVDACAFVEFLVDRLMRLK